MSVTDSAIHVVGAAIFDDQGRCLLAKRSAQMANPLLWEFPGGKVEPGETPQLALERELREELAIEVEVLDFIARGEARVSSGKEIILDVYRAALVRGAATPREHAAIAWVFPKDFVDYTFPEADLPAVEALSK